MKPPVFRSKILTIKPYCQIDEDRFVEMAVDDVSLQYMGGTTGSEKEERAVFKKIFDIYKSHSSRIFWIWGIYLNDILQGHLELKESEHTTDNELEIVFMVHPQCRNKGVMTEVLSFIKSHQDHWQKRIIATVHQDNPASLHLLEKWGVDDTTILQNEEDESEHLKLTLATLD